MEIGTARSSGMYDRFVVNDQLDRAVEEVCAFLEEANGLAHVIRHTTHLVNFVSSVSSSLLNTASGSPAPSMITTRAGSRAA